MNYQQYRPTGFRLLPPVVKNLLIINGLFFLATYALQRNEIVDLTNIFGFHYFGSEKFYPHQFISYMFMHGGWQHILFNMFALWMFGNTLENMWGPKRFLTYYVITGIGAAIIHSLVMYIDFSSLQNAFNLYAESPNPDGFKLFLTEHFKGQFNPQVAREFINNWQLNPSNSGYAKESLSLLDSLIQGKMDVPTVGASGAVFGILLAFGILFPNALIYLYFAFPIKAKWFVIGYGLIELFAGFSNRSGDNVAHFAHLGGMLFGYFLIVYWRKKN